MDVVEAYAIAINESMIPAAVDKVVGHCKLQDLRTKLGL